MIAELATANLGQRHKWRAWIVNTQHSEQLGSHWFTVIVGAAVGNVPQLLQSTASSSALRRIPELSQSHASSSAEPTATEHLERSQSLQSIGTHADPITNNYANLFESPDPDLSNALHWAHANAMHPHVAAWLHACSQWDSAVATKEHERRNKRRKLCKEHDIPLTKVVNTNTELETAMEYIRRQLTNRIKNMRAQTLLQSKSTEPLSAHSMQKRPVSADTTLQAPRKKTEYGCDNKLDNYFTPRAAGDARPDIEELRIPDVATDVIRCHLMGPFFVVSFV